MAGSMRIPKRIRFSLVMPRATSTEGVVDALSRDIREDIPVFYRRGSTDLCTLS